jgi:hypothetical protein
MDAVPVVATMLMSPDGKVLLIHRADSDMWELPADQVGPGEALEDAAWRVTHARTGYRLGDVRRREKDGTDATTFAVSIESAFEPALDRAHDAFVWMAPSDRQREG